VKKILLYCLNACPLRPVEDLSKNVLGTAMSKPFKIVKPQSYHHFCIFSRMGSNSMSLISTCTITLEILVFIRETLCCTFSSTSFVLPQVRPPCLSTIIYTRSNQRLTKQHGLYINVLLIIPSILLAVLAAFIHCADTSRFSWIRTPKSCSIVQVGNKVMPPSHLMALKNRKIGILQVKK